MAIEEIPCLYPLSSNYNLTAIHRLKGLCDSDNVQIGGCQIQVELKNKEDCFEKAGSHRSIRVDDHGPGYSSINTFVPPGFSYSPAPCRRPRVTTLPASKSTAGRPLRVMCVCMPRVEPTEAGDYKLCFDNSFSTISEKLVFFELIFDSLQDEEEVEGWAEAVEPEEILEVKMEDIKVRPGELGPLLPDLWHCSLPSHLGRGLPGPDPTFPT